MIGALGHLAIVFAFLLAAGGAVVAFLPGPSGAIWARRAAFAVFGLVAIAVGLMEYALITHDFSVGYVYEVGSRETPLYYTIISLWGALEGSILFWAFLLSLYTSAFLLLSRGTAARVERYATSVLLAISTFFLFVVAWPGNPFVLVSPTPLDGNGPNALLQNHWLMGVHPPLLYLGYVGLAVPFAISLGTLIAGSPRPEELRLIRRWALLPWSFLSLGIMGGMWWSYAVLGWGGYWSWDPVENASLMPWLVTTAFLHSLQVQERRQMLKVWTISLIVAAFTLSVLGTTLTRSGVLISVHAFSQSTIGPLFVAFLAVMLAVSIGLLAWRSEELGAPGVLEAIVCRETAFLFNNLLLVAITFTVLLGTLFPLVAEALQGTQLSVGGPYFNHVAVPIGFALLFLMGIGPALPWGAARLEELQYRLLTPVAVGAGVLCVLLLLGVRGPGPLVTFALAAFALAVTAERTWADVRSRMGNTREGAPVAAARLARANPRRYGGYLAHVGVLLVVIGIAASQSYGTRVSETVRPGQAFSVDGYNLVYRGWTPHPSSNKMTVQARLDLSRDGRSLGTLLPAQNYFTGVKTAIVTPAIREQPFTLLTDLLAGRNPLPELARLLHRENPFEDVYTVLAAVSTSPRGPATVQVLINPMVGFIWLGGALVGLGGFAALLPARRRRRVPVAVPEPVRLQPEEVTA